MTVVAGQVANTSHVQIDLIVHQIDQEGACIRRLVHAISESVVRLFFCCLHLMNKARQLVSVFVVFRCLVVCHHRVAVPQLIDATRRILPKGF